MKFIFEVNASSRGFKWLRFPSIK